MFIHGFVTDKKLKDWTMWRPDCFFFPWMKYYLVSIENWMKYYLVSHRKLTFWDPQLSTNSIENCHFWNPESGPGPRIRRDQTGNLHVRKFGWSVGWSVGHFGFSTKYKTPPRGEQIYVLEYTSIQDSSLKFQHFQNSDVYDFVEIVEIFHVFHMFHDAKKTRKIFYKEKHRLVWKNTIFQRPPKKAQTFFHFVLWISLPHCLWFFHTDESFFTQLFNFELQVQRNLPSQDKLSRKIKGSRKIKARRYYQVTP